LKREVSRAFQRSKLEGPREEDVEERSPTTNPWSPSLEDSDLVDGCVLERRGGRLKMEGV
jgi:hypothetical protein